MTDEPDVEPAAWADNSGNLFVKNAEDEYDWKRVAPASEEEVPDFSVPLVRADHLRQLIKDRIDELGEEDRTRQVEIEELERLRNQLEVSDQ